LTSRPAARSVRTQDDEKGRIVRRLRTNHGGIFAAFLALFLKLALITVSSAALPQDHSSLLADLAVVCTPNGAEHRDSAPVQPTSACDHCTLCPSLHIASLLPSSSSAIAPIVTDSVTAVASAAVLVPSSLERPSSRGPPSFHI